MLKKLSSLVYVCLVDFPSLSQGAVTFLNTKLIEAVYLSDPSVEPCGTPIDSLTLQPQLTRCFWLAVMGIPKNVMH